MKITTNLIEHGSTYYVILNFRDSNNKRKQKWIPTGIEIKGNNKRLAKEKLEEIKTNYIDYIPAEYLLKEDENNIYFDTYLKQWLESHKNKIEENTYESYYRIVTKTAEYFNDKKIKLIDLKPTDIQKYYDFLFSNGLSGNSVLHYHSVVRKSLDTAIKLNMINTNIADKIERPKKNQFIGDHYNIEELQELFEKSKGDPLEIVILLASFYGLRRSEILGLKWNAIDMKNDTITIKHKVIETMINGKRTLILKDKTKNSSSYRSLPLVPEIKEALLKHKRKIEENMKLLGNTYNYEYKDYICVDKTGKIFRPEYITDHFSWLLKKQGLRHIRFHDLRHSAASLLLRQNIPMKAIQEWLGHSTYSTTANIYAHLESNTKTISANALASAINFK